MKFKFVILSILLLIKSYAIQNKNATWKTVIYNNTNLKLYEEFDKTKINLKLLFISIHNQINKVINSTPSLLNIILFNKPPITEKHAEFIRIAYEFIKELNQTELIINSMYQNFTEEVFDIFENSKNNKLTPISIKTELDHTYSKIKKNMKSVIYNIKDFALQIKINNTRDIVTNTEYTVYPIILYYEKSKVKLSPYIVHNITSILNKMPKEKLDRMNKTLLNWNSYFKHYV